MSKNYRESKPSDIVDLSFLIKEKSRVIENDAKLFRIETRDYPKISMKIETYEYEVKD